MADTHNSPGAARSPCTDADKLIEEGKVEVERVNKIIADNLTQSYPVRIRPNIFIEI